MGYGGVTRAMSPIDRLFFGSYEDENGCWLRSAAKKKWGYTELKVNGMAVRAHRFSYEFFIAEIPTGLTTIIFAAILLALIPGILSL